jgi:hypothetical protein
MSVALATGAGVRTHLLRSGRDTHPLGGIRRRDRAHAGKICVLACGTNDKAICRCGVEERQEQMAKKTAKRAGARRSRAAGKSRSGKTAKQQTSRSKLKSVAKKTAKAAAVAAGMAALNTAVGELAPGNKKSQTRGEDTKQKP